jgi:hypothetical protein
MAEAGHAPAATPQSVTTTEDTAKSITLSGVDKDSPSLTFSIGTFPTHGSLSAVSAASCKPARSGTSCTATVTYTPATDYSGSDSFTYAVSDGSLNSAQATVSITVTPASVAPMADDTSATTMEETAVLINLTGSDVEGTGLTFSIVAGPSHGLLGPVSEPSCAPSGSGALCAAAVIYTPTPDYAGPDSFTFKVNDGSLDSALATVSIAVTPVNDPPFFEPIFDQFTQLGVQPENVPIMGVAPGPADEAGQMVTMTATSSDPVIAANPTISGDGPTRTLSYQLGGGAGTATIMVTATDDGGTLNGGIDTFSRTFSVTVAPAAAPPPATAEVTNVDPTGGSSGAPVVTVTNTFNPIDFDGDGVADCYFIVPPNPFNLIPSGADQIPEGLPNVISTDPNNPGDLVQICDVPQTFTTEIDLGQWITTPGTTETNVNYEASARDPDLTPTGECPPGTTCLNIFTGTVPAGSLTFTPGDPFAVKSTVILHTVNHGGGPSTREPLAGVAVRVFDRNSPAFQAVAGRKNPPGKLYGVIFERDQGRISACITDGTGICVATVAQTGDDLVIGKYVDSLNHKIVYVGRKVSPDDFVNGIAEKRLQIKKELRRGVFQKYHHDGKTVVCEESAPGCRRGHEDGDD